MSVGVYCIVCRGNRNKEGKTLYPILVNWYFKNEATWGKAEL